MPEIAKTKVFDYLRDKEVTNTPKRLSGKEWLRNRLERGKYGLCGSHYHLECKQCGSTKCVGESGYKRYHTTKQVCDCNKEATNHIVVPFDHFGQHIDFPH